MFFVVPHGVRQSFEKFFHQAFRREYGDAFTIAEKITLQLMVQYELFKIASGFGRLRK